MHAVAPRELFHRRSGIVLGEDLDDLRFGELARSHGWISRLPSSAEIHSNSWLRFQGRPQRAFLKTLKPRLIAIAEAAATKTGPIDGADLHARIEAGREEYQRELTPEHVTTH